MRVWTTDGSFVGGAGETTFLTFAGGHVALQLVVPVGFRRQRRLHFLLVQAVQAAF